MKIYLAIHYSVLFGIHDLSYFVFYYVRFVRIKSYFRIKKITLVSVLYIYNKNLFYFLKFDLLISSDETYSWHISYHELRTRPIIHRINGMVTQNSRNHSIESILHTFSDSFQRLISPRWKILCLISCYPFFLLHSHSVRTFCQVDLTISCKGMQLGNWLGLFLIGMRWIQYVKLRFLCLTH